jgi:hypothetical protein
MTAAAHHPWRVPFRFVTCHCGKHGRRESRLETRPALHERALQACPRRSRRSWNSSTSSHGLISESSRSTSPRRDHVRFLGIPHDPTSSSSPAAAGGVIAAEDVDPSPARRRLSPIGDRRRRGRTTASAHCNALRNGRFEQLVEPASLRFRSKTAGSMFGKRHAATSHSAARPFYNGCPSGHGRPSPSSSSFSSSAL